ncbi:MAG: PD-(D/E)XK nuclease family protein [Pasteurellaceae bacterium]|nr:PD-(D/E)XK nuclease family protein [Pasteurellaceae bacterium]
MSNLDKLFSNLRELNQYLKEQDSKHRKTELYDANRFSPFRFLRTDEMGLSRILAFLLTPEEEHGQGDLLLNSFLKHLKLYQFLAYDNVIVHTEKLTSNNRRHDILLEGWIKNKRVWVISIENKLHGAGDQIEQVSDYIKDLKDLGVPFYFVYLPNYHIDPTEESIRKEEWEDLKRNNQACIIDSKCLVNWLEQMPIIAPKMQFFINDFKNFIKEELMGITENSDELVKKITSDNELLETVLEICNNALPLYDHLIVILISQLQEMCKKEFTKLCDQGWIVNEWGGYRSKYVGIGFNNQENDCLGIGLECTDGFFENTYYGIWATKDEFEQTDYDKLQSFFNNRFTNLKSSKYWIKWKYAENNLRNWNVQTWKGINDGSLALQIFSLWKPFIEVIHQFLIKEGNTITFEK